MRQFLKRIFGVMIAALMVCTVFTSALPVQAAKSKYVHVLYRTTDGDLKAVWKLKVTPNEETKIDLDKKMKGYDKKGVIGTIEDLNNITGIIVIKYRPKRDGDKAPSDLEAFIKTLKKTDTFQTSNPKGSLWTYDDPSSEMNWGGTIKLVKAKKKK